MPGHLIQLNWTGCDAVPTPASMVEWTMLYGGGMGGVTAMACCTRITVFSMQAGDKKALWGGRGSCSSHLSYDFKRFLTRFANQEQKELMLTQYKGFKNTTTVETYVCFYVSIAIINAYLYVSKGILPLCIGTSCSRVLLQACDKCNGLNFPHTHRNFTPLIHRVVRSHLSLYI